jgi:hypothetical protein
VDKNLSRPVDGLFAARDPNGDPISWYSLWDDNADTSSGHFWIPNGGDQNAKEVIYIPASDLQSTQFVTGSVSGSDDLYFSAYDGDSWGPWAHLTWTTALPSDFSLIA